MTTSEKIKARRKELRITLEQVADYVGVGVSTVHSWERGRTENIKSIYIQRLAKILKVSPTYFIYEDELATLDDMAFKDEIEPLPKLELSEVEENIFGLIMQLSFDEKLDVYNYCKEMVAKHSK